MHFIHFPISVVAWSYYAFVVELCFNLLSELHYVHQSSCHIIVYCCFNLLSELDYAHHVISLSIVQDVLDCR